MKILHFQLTSCVLVFFLGFAFCGCEDTTSVVNGTGKDTEVILKDSVLTENQTWEQEKTYIVEGTLEIPSSITLEILPGTTVKFGHDANIIVRGTLKVGTPLTQVALEESVFLTSNNSSPEAGDWNGILFDHTRDIDSFLRGTVVENAQVALDIKTASPSVYDCILRYNETAIALNGSESKIQYNAILDNDIGISTIERKNRPRIEYNIFRNNQSGILCENVDSIIQYNNFENNEYALRLNVKFNLSVPNNWWGTPISEEIDAIILDSNDTDIITKQIGTVTYETIAEERIVDAGPRE